jgi:hypothetical protein
VAAHRSGKHYRTPVAMRQKDVEFCRALARRRIVKVGTLRDRLAQVAGIAEAQRAQIAGFIDAL